MKRTFLVLAAVAILTTACTNEAIDTPSADARITFRVNGDFSLSMSPMTRALEADGKAMTDLWILDYIGNTMQQQIHQTSSDEDFGSPTLNLAVGDHHIYFVASRGKTATLDADAHTLTFGTVSDTFYKDYAISVVPSSIGSRSVTLDRCVTRLRISITDAMPVGIASIDVAPSDWYYGIDYTTGEPVTATTLQTITTNVPSGYEGQTNVAANIFGFSPSEEWTTDVAINAKSTDNTVLGSVTITNVPLKRNRTTEYSGPLFSTEGLATVSLSTDWADSYTATW